MGMQLLEPKLSRDFDAVLQMLCSFPSAVEQQSMDASEDASRAETEASPTNGKGVY